MIYTKVFAIINLSFILCNSKKSNPEDVIVDFVIIGGGTAGCVIANRLSENPNWNILLLEAGNRSRNVLMDIPALVPITHFTTFNWGYLMEKQDNMGLGLTDQRIACPRGKGLGGSSLIDFLIYTRGNKRDYDLWEEMGNPGWNYESMLQYFIRSENATSPNPNLDCHGYDESTPLQTSADDAFIKAVNRARYNYEQLFRNFFKSEYTSPNPNLDYHGYDGPINVESTPLRTPAGDAFIKAINRLGYNCTDINGRNQEGVSYLQTTTRMGLRLNTDKAYLLPVQNRSNLIVAENMLATKILISKNRAYQVEFYRNGILRKVRVRKEVILSAGAINSPQLLMLSGIGPKEDLKALNITVHKDLPVGKKLIDRIMFPGLIYTVNEKYNFNPYQILNLTNYLKLFANKQNILSSPAFLEAISFLNLNVSTSERPNMELLFASSGLQTDFGIFTRRMIRISDETYNNYWQPLETKRTVQIYVILLHPKSSGKLTLKTTDPNDSPSIFGNYFTDPDGLDVKTFIKGIRFAQKIMASEEFKKFDARLVNSSLPGCKNLTFDSDSYWECALRHVGVSIFHPMTTCKMGPSSDKEAVVDNSLKVHGLENVRVADASVIPLSITGHPKATVIAIGEKVSDIIKKHFEDLAMNKTAY